MNKIKNAFNKAQNKVCAFGAVLPYGYHEAL